MINVDDIVKAIQSDCVNITVHARKEAKEDSLMLDDIFFSICHGEIIENYPDDFPYPSCLIYGMTSSGDPIHSVWAYDSEDAIAVLITVYRPDPELWIAWKERRTL